MSLRCEALGLGALFGAAAVTASLLWHLLVRPHVVLAWFRGGAPAARMDPTSLRALRVAVGTLVFVLAAVAGAAASAWAPTFR